MRFMLTFRVPPEEGNAAMKDGKFHVSLPIRTGRTPARGGVL